MANSAVMNLMLITSKHVPLATQIKMMKETIEVYEKDPTKETEDKMYMAATMLFLRSITKDEDNKGLMELMDNIEKTGRIAETFVTEKKN